MLSGLRGDSGRSALAAPAARQISEPQILGSMGLRWQVEDDCGRNAIALRHEAYQAAQLRGLQSCERVDPPWMSWRNRPAPQP